MKNVITSIGVTIAIFASAIAHATTPATQYNQVSFTVTEQAELSNDILNITLQAYAQGQDLRQLASEVNDAMNWALNLANKEKSIQARTMDYQTNAHYEKGRQQGWRVSQSLRLSSQNTDDLSKLTEKLQKKLQIKSATYETDPRKREALTQQLTQQVLKKFSQRATLVSKALGSAGFKLVHVQVGNGSRPLPRPMMQMDQLQHKSIAASAPVFQAGTQKIHLTASGTIELMP